MLYIYILVYAKIGNELFYFQNLCKVVAISFLANKPAFKKRAEDLNKEFIKEEIQMAINHMKRCSTLYVINELNGKITKRYHYPLIRMVKSGALTIAHADGVVKQLELPGTAMGMQNGTATLKDSLIISSKTKCRLTYYPAISLLFIQMNWKFMSTLRSAHKYLQQLYS